MARGDAKKRQIKAYTITAARQILKWAQKKYNLNEKFNDATIIVSFEKKRINSYGGWHKNRNGKWRPYINIRANSCLNFTPQTQNEYDWYKKDPEIGNKWVQSWKAWIRVECAHEIAHVIEMAGPYINPKQKRGLEKKFGRSKMSDDHTETFQAIYRVIRKKFVNRLCKIK
jgi:hypothetical protein